MRNNRNENLEAGMPQRQPGGNYDKPEMQVSPARTDCQQEQLPGVLDCFGRGIDDDAPKLEKTQAAMGSMRHPKFKFKTSSEFSVLDKKYNSQLERFLSTLMMADHRLVGATARHRIQVTDCTVADAGAKMMEGWTTEIYNRLSAILSGEDRWEIRFTELEGFVNKHGRLPQRTSESSYEKMLARWVNTQCTAFRRQRLPLHRFQKLLASLPLIRRRAAGWQMGDADGRFRQRCYELGEYVQLHHRLPDLTRRRIGSKLQKLAKWFAEVRRGNIRLDAGKMKLLQEVDPMVKAELQKWQNAPRLQRPQWEQKFSQFSGFVLTKGRLPKRYGEKKFERSCYEWLRLQCRKLKAGCLPDDLAQRLRNAHPLIAAYIDAFA